MLRVDVFSDLICPWCFVGKRHLDLALAGPLSEEVGIAYRAYQLYPTVPPEGLSQDRFMELRYGDRGARGRGRMRAIYEEIEAEGDAVGITFSFGDIKQMPNTRDAHRLMILAGQYGLQAKVAEGLFQQHFCAGGDVGDRDTLIAVADGAGFDGDQVAAYLADADQGLPALLAELDFALEHGIEGVPCYVLERQVPVQGVHSPETLARLFKRAIERLV